MTKPSSAPLTRRRLLGAAAATAGLTALAAAGCSPAQQSPSPQGKVTLNVRLWDQQVQAAYDQSFQAFTAKNPNITVKTTLVPWADYFTKLRTDISGGNADDLFLMNGSNIDPYIKNKSLIEIDSSFDNLKGDWLPAAVEQYTKDGKLWGVPQLTDGGIAIYYNKSLLKGVTEAQLNELEWKPGTATDPFLEALQKLSLDVEGRNGLAPEFKTARPKQWGFNASQDLQAIYYNFIGSNGGQFQAPDSSFTFDSPESVAAFEYLVKLINVDKVSPPASNTNNNGDFCRDQFLQGKIVLFQSGIYNLKNVADGAKFEWGIAPLPAGPKGRISVVNNVVVAGNAATKNPDATRLLLQWLGSAEGAGFVGASGAALPAVTSAQPKFAEYWKGKNVDPTPFAKAGEGQTTRPPSGEKFAAAQAAWKPHFDEMFLGRKPVTQALKDAQSAANKALQA